MLYNISFYLQKQNILTNFAYMKYIILLLVTIGFGILYCFLGVAGSAITPDDVAWYSPTSVLAAIVAIIFVCGIVITSVGIYTEFKQK